MSLVHVRHRNRGASLLLGAITAVSACGPLDEAKGGSLGNGSFAYGCVDGNDAFCPKGSIFTPAPNTPFPSAIALNAPFNLAYYPTDSSTYQDVAVLPVSPDFIATANSVTPAFTALRPGTAWFYAQLPNGQILDITSVSAAQIAGITVADSSTVPAQSYSETTDSTVTFTATAVDSTNALLAGAVVYTWSTSDPKVVSFVNGGSSSSIDVLFPSSGHATVTVTAQGIQDTVTVTVTGPGIGL